MRGIATRMQRVGLHLPFERCWGPIVKAAAACGLEVRDHMDSLHIVRDLKTRLKDKHVIVDTHLTEFPDDPRRLEWFATAYAADDQPTSVQEAEIMKQSVSLRSSSKACKDSATTQVSVVDKRSSMPSMPFMPSMEQYWSCMQMHMQQMMGVHPFASGSAQRPAKRLRAIEDAPAVEAQPAAPTGEGVEKEDVDEKGEEAKNDVVKEEGGEPSHAVLLDMPRIPPVMKKPSKAVTPVTPKATAKAGAKAGAKVGAKPAAKAGAKACAKAGAKAGAKPGAKVGAKAKTTNCKTTKLPGGWTMETRIRPTGQKDKHYRSPGGQWFRIFGDAVNAGLKL